MRLREWLGRRKQLFVAGANFAPSTATLRHLTALQTPNSMNFFDVVGKSIFAKQRVDSPIAVSRIFLGERFDFATKLRSLTKICSSVCLLFFIVSLPPRRLD